MATALWPALLRSLCRQNVAFDAFVFRMSFSDTGCFRQCHGVERMNRRTCAMSPIWVRARVAYSITLHSELYTSLLSGQVTSPTSSYDRYRRLPCTRPTPLISKSATSRAVLRARTLLRMWVIVGCWNGILGWRGVMCTASKSKFSHVKSLRKVW